MVAISTKRVRAFAMAVSVVGSAWLAVGRAWAAKDYPGCTPLADSEFKQVTLFARTGGNSLDEPIKMAFDMNAAGEVDIYFVERKGKVRKYVASTKEVLTLGSVPANIEFEGGLSGIVLDPGFKTNKNIFLYYGFGTGADFKFRVTRVTLNSAGMMDMATEKVVITIPATAARLHTGGAMVFDPEGNLFITVGDNAAGEEGPGNTNDLRGKVLRIKPTADGSYTVPAGNLFPPGTAKTRPEIYVMGTRNAYSITYDPVKKVVTWGDVGPDGKGSAEEHNSAAAPGNYGYPYYAGDQITLIPGGTPEKPVNNNAKNTGLRDLPPAITATNAYPQACAITGPIYRYDPLLKSTVKFPPHFEGMWFVADFNTGRMDTIQLNSTATTKTAIGAVFKGIHLDRALDFQQGPDGALYVINYSGWFNATVTTAIIRIEYSGSCRPGTVALSGAAVAPGRTHLKLRGPILEVGEVGRHTLQIADMQGRVVASFQGEGAASYDLSRVTEGRGALSGLYMARLATAAGSHSRAVVLGR